MQQVHRHQESTRQRLLLGLKGTMSETESLILKQRMHTGKRAKAHRGELGMRVSMGYIRQLSGGVVKDPDEQLQSVIERVFEPFERKRIFQREEMNVYIST